MQIAAPGGSGGGGGIFNRGPQSSQSVPYGHQAAYEPGPPSEHTPKSPTYGHVLVHSAESGGKGGGGRPDMAQGGGPDGAKADEAIAAVRGKLSAG